MKTFFFTLFVFFIQNIFACDCLDFHKAAKKAYAENKFILAHFSNFHKVNSEGKGYLELNGLTDEEKEIFNSHFIYVCISKIYSDNIIEKYNT